MIRGIMMHGITTATGTDILLSDLHFTGDTVLSEAGTEIHTTVTGTVITAITMHGTVRTTMDTVGAIIVFITPGGILFLAHAEA
jgi:uncharacterized phosphosugar-binding protein